MAVFLDFWCSLDVVSHQLHVTTTWQQRCLKTQIAIDGTMSQLYCATSVIRAKLEFLKMLEGIGASFQFLIL